ncbi:MAG: hypothetical protein D6701_03330 [Gemmatimonadetes bacterium]|nr:MAG: hypothetical protein D6701_03330 [Gemmatimonadota bacterium]
MAQTLTEIERKILDYMVQYLRTNTYQPSIREIGERFGIKSTKTVSEHLQALADKGFLERDPSRSRGVKILGVDLNAQTVSIPCYVELPEERAGLRSERAEMFLSIDRRLAGARGAYFVRARGDELVSIGAHEGDFVLIEPAIVDDLEDGAVVVATLEDEGPGYFRFSRNGRGVFLRPLPEGEATVVEDPETIPLMGRVAALFRRFDGTPALVSTTAH